MFSSIVTNFGQGIEKLSRFGEKPIYEMIRENAAEGSDQILKRIVEELNSFQKGYNSTDDVTLVVIKT